MTGVDVCGLRHPRRNEIVDAGMPAAFTCRRAFRLTPCAALGT